MNGKGRQHPSCLRVSTPWFCSQSRDLNLCVWGRWVAQSPPTGQNAGEPEGVDCRSAHDDAMT